MHKNDTPENAPNDAPNCHPWPKVDRIRWVEWRVRRLTIYDGRYIDDRGRLLLEERRKELKLKLTFRVKSNARPDQVAYYAVWLFYEIGKEEKKNLSWGKISRALFGDATEAFRLRARRMHKQVERELLKAEIVRPRAMPKLRTKSAKLRQLPKERDLPFLFAEEPSPMCPKCKTPLRPRADSAHGLQCETCGQIYGIVYSGLAE